MIKIREFKHEDLYNITAQEAQKRETGLFDPLNKSEAYTIFDSETSIIICILVFTPITEERYVVGALTSAYAGPYFVGLRKIVFTFLDEYYKVPRLECVVHAKFEQGHRLVKLLGFQLEGTLRKFQNGEDYCLYTRIN